MLACLLFHLNDVNEYATTNGMDAALLSTLFAEYILRPRPSSSSNNNSTSTAAESDREQEWNRGLVEAMISNVDAIIDEKAVEALNDHP